MTAPSNSQTLNRNQILAALPRPQYSLLFASLQMVNLARGAILYDLADPIRSGLFIVNGLVSFLATTEDGASTQVGVVGDEGLVGVSLILGISKAPHQAVVQIPGLALRIRSEVLLDAFGRAGPLQEILLRYLHSLICQISQSGACNRFHSLEQRLCRWLLLAQDRLQRDDLPLTQEALARMLGATRTNVTTVAFALKQAGLVQYRHGQIQISSRAGLEKRCCECYRVITEEMGEFRAE